MIILEDPVDLQLANMSVYYNLCNVDWGIYKQYC